MYLVRHRTSLDRGGTETSKGGRLLLRPVCCWAFFGLIQSRLPALLGAAGWLASSLLFSQLLDDPRFRVITKIKTIGSTYMAASGVTPDVNTNGFNSAVKVSREGRKWLAPMHRWRSSVPLIDGESPDWGRPTWKAPVLKQSYNVRF